MSCALSSGLAPGVCSGSTRMCSSLIISTLQSMTPTMSKFLVESAAMISKEGKEFHITQVLSDKCNSYTPNKIFVLDLLYKIITDGIQR